jgi:hypothetical protein
MHSIIALYALFGKSIQFIMKMFEKVKSWLFYGFSVWLMFVVVCECSYERLFFIIIFRSNALSASHAFSLNLTNHFGSTAVFLP